MWDRPDILDKISAVLIAAAVLMFLYGVTWIVVRQPTFALRHIEVTGDAQHVTQAQIETIVEKQLKGTFFTLSLPQVRSAFEKLPWVREVRLRRHWPDRLEVNLVEHVPLARWGNTALVNTEGDVFHAAYDGKLPVFVGPDGTSKEISIQYEHFRRSLSAIGLKPVMVQVTPRQAWQVRVEGGPTLELGREDIEARLARYIDAHERTVGALKRRVDYVDLRYANGFAVRIPELKGEPHEKSAAKGKSAARRISGAVAPGAERRSGVPL